MRRKLQLLIILTAIIIIFIPILTFADSWDSGTGTVTIDNNGSNITAGSLATRIEESDGSPGNGVPALSNVLILNVTATGTFNSTDISTINSMDNMTNLDVATSVTVSTGGYYVSRFLRRNASIQTVNFPAEEFGDFAFDDCTSLTSVSLPKATTFESAAFRDCTSLTSVSLPKATTFGNEAFEDCTSLTSAILPQAEEFGYEAFRDCTSLTSVSLPKATTFGYSAFRDCTSLTSVSLPKATTFETAAFSDCTSLTSVSLPKATTFGYSAFRDCTSINSLEFGSTIPTVSSWGTGFTPGTLYVPDDAAITAYDANYQHYPQNDTDGLWEGWTLVVAPVTTVVSNPQTGEASIFEEIVEWFGCIF